MVNKRKMLASDIILNAVILFLIFLLLYPLFMTLWCSFKDNNQFLYQRWYPTLPLKISNYSTAFSNIWYYLVNTIIVGVVGTAGLLIISSMSAYTFARMKFFGRETLFMLVLALMMMPGILNLVPSYMIYNNLGLTNTLWALILPEITTGPVFGVFLLRSFFGSIPEDIFEAARVDGVNEFQAYWMISLPLSLPIMGTLCIMNIVGAWNSYLWPLITIQNDRLYTISVGLMVRFTTMFSTNYPVSFAGYVLAAVPLVLLFSYANRFYIQGLTSAAIKL